jgi:hypothetical protein
VTDWFDRLTRLAALGERVSTLTEGVTALAKRVEDHQTRIVRLETNRGDRAAGWGCAAGRDEAGLG